MCVAGPMRCVLKIKVGLSQQQTTQIPTDNINKYLCTRRHLSALVGAAPLDHNAVDFANEVYRIYYHGISMISRSLLFHVRS